MNRRVGAVALLCVASFGIAWSFGFRAGAQTKAAGSDREHRAGWVKGTGWGWIWGKDDEVGALNAMSPESKRNALSLAKEGRVYDLGVTYSRNSFKWPGHSPGEVITFRGPEGEKRQGDHAFVKQGNRLGVGWHSCAVFINDNIGTQIDGLGHVTVGSDNHWYNGFRESDWGGNFGIRKCDATTIPPIVARGVLLDIATLKHVDALPARYEITPGDVDRALEQEQVELRPGDVVLIRTGAMRYWGKDGADVERLKVHDSAGISLETAKYLVGHFGAMLIGADTSGLELQPPLVDQGTFIPVHNYLLIEQGVHIGEFHFLEDLARDKAYEFCYVCSTAKIAGTVAGFALRPIALR
jgi:kynurenine formamidase